VIPDAAKITSGTVVAQGDRILALA